MSDFERVSIPTDEDRWPARSLSANAILELMRDDSRALRIPIPEGQQADAFRQKFRAAAKHRKILVGTTIQDGHLLIWRRK